MQLDQSVGSSSRWSGASRSVRANDTRWFPQPHCYEGRPGNDRWGWTRDRLCTTRRHRTWPRTAEVPTRRCLRQTSRTSCHSAMSANHLPHHTAALQFYYWYLHNRVSQKCQAGISSITYESAWTDLRSFWHQWYFFEIHFSSIFCYKFYRQSFLFYFITVLSNISISFCK